MKVGEIFAARPAVTLCPILLFLGLFLFSCLTNADEVIMKNGDHLTGDVVRQEKGKLKLKTDYAGTMKITLSKVREIKFDKPVVVLLKDYSQMEALSLSLSADGEWVIVNQASVSEPTKIDIKSIKVIDPEPWEIGHGHEFNGSVNIAFKSEQGNSREINVEINYEMTYRRQWDRFYSAAQVDFQTNQGQVTTNKWSVYNKYSRYFPSPWFPSVWFNIKQDLFSDLRLQYMTGVSAGYKFYDHKYRHLSSELGLYYLHQEFTDEGDVDFVGPGWFINYDEFIWKDYLQFYHKQFGFFAANNVDKLLWQAWTGFRVPLLHGIVSSIEYEIDYDSQPAGNSLSMDTTLRIKLGYEW